MIFYDLFLDRNSQAGSTKYFFRCCVRLLVDASCVHSLKMSCVPTTSAKGLESSGMAEHLPLSTPASARFIWAFPAAEHPQDSWAFA